MASGPVHLSPQQSGTSGVAGSLSGNLSGPGVRRKAKDVDITSFTTKFVGHDLLGQLQTRWIAGRGRLGRKASLRAGLPYPFTWLSILAYWSQKSVTLSCRRRPRSPTQRWPQSPIGAGFAALLICESGLTTPGSPDSNDALLGEILSRQVPSDSCAKTRPIHTGKKPARAFTPPGRTASRPSTREMLFPRST